MAHNYAQTVKQQADILRIICKSNASRKSQPASYTAVEGICCGTPDRRCAGHRKACAMLMK
jgi:hypothetical protein